MDTINRLPTRYCTSYSCTVQYGRYGYG
eukprot:COSAG02_NODE_53156_length_303_cov_1.205882_2_plen_27_part_01